ncbi:ABC transporter ATP-binding protein [Sphingobium sp. AS12]|uniref:ABC transporter ATP-binding protein n=1 Tax=Sphingobium sp. AS12 TaxID=2849495 RepID=UPI0034A11149
MGKRFGARWVLRDLSFALAPGALLGLVGANGGGKTTTLRMLAGLLRPDEGTGRVFGYDIARPSNALRRQVGYMSQRLSLYPELSVAENLSFRARVLKLPRARSAIAESIDRLGLAPVTNIRFDRLSGGWARKVQFAAATIHRPKLLLLDEPTAGLDAASRHIFWRWLTEFASEGHIVIVSTHDLAEAERCPAILHYVAGKAEGPMSPSTLIGTAGCTTLEEAVLSMTADPG